MRHTDDDVQGHPRDRKPARPVLATKQEPSGDDSEEFGDFYRDRIGRKGPRSQSLVPMTDKTGNPYSQVEDGDDRYGEWALCSHGVLRCSLRSPARAGRGEQSNTQGRVESNR